MPNNDSDGDPDRRPGPLGVPWRPGQREIPEGAKLIRDRIDARSLNSGAGLLIGKHPKKGGIECFTGEQIGEQVGF